MRRQTVFRLLLSTAVVLAFLLAGAVGFVLLRGSTLPPKDEMAVAVADIDLAAREPAPAAQPAAPPAAKIDYPADKELYKQGRALLRGDGIEADSIRAVAYLERAVSRGPDRGKAAFELGEAYLRGRFGVEADPVKARLYLDQAIELKHGGAPLTLGRALLFGEGLEAEPEAGAAMLEAELANPKNVNTAAYDLGRFFLKGNKQLAADPGKARTYLDMAVTGGHGRAAVLLGRSLLRGDELPADPASGRAILDREIETGKEAAFAAYEIGAFYLKGTETEPADPETALRYLSLALEKGHPDAGYTLGRALLRSEGVPADQQAGAALLEEHAATHKKPGPSALLLGQFYLKGGGNLAADPVKARAYLDQAMTAGEKDAPLTLARALLRGDGLPEDPAAGVALLEGEVAKGRNVATAAYELGQHYLRASRSEDSGEVAEGDAPPDDLDVYGYKHRAFTNAPAALSGVAAAARAWLERAGAAGHKDAAVALGRALLRGDGMPQDIVGGARLLEAEAAAGANPGAAAYELGAYLLDAGTAEEKARGRAWMEQAIAAGQSRATTTLGRWLLKQDKPSDRAAGIELLQAQMGAGKDVASVAITLGSFYLKGDDAIPADPQMARSMLEAAIDAGNKDALFVLGRALIRGKELPRDIAAGAALLEQAIAEGKSVAAASIELGTLYLKGGDGLPADPAKAGQFLQQAVEAGDKNAPMILGRAILRGDIGGSAETAIALLRQEISAGRNVSAAAFELGTFYLMGGDGIAPDPARASSYFEQAGSAGNKNAGLSQGRTLLKSGSAADRDTGARLLETAASSDPERAPSLFLEIGKAYLNGTPADPGRAKDYLELSASLGNVDALVELGRAAADGKFGENGGPAAVRYLEQAVAAGSASAVTRLARIHIDGKGGVSRDAGRGLEILHRASDRGNTDAMRELMSIYLTGISKRVAKDYGRARSVFDQYRRFASADDARVHALIIDAAEGTAGFFQNRSETFRNVLAQYMNLPREKRAYAAQQLLRVNRDAAIFVTQTLLRSAGYFSGEVNGVYAPETIDAIARACRAGGEGKCGPKTLHGDTIGFIARNLS